MKTLQKPEHEEQLLVNAANGTASVKWEYLSAPLFTFYGVVRRKFFHSERMLAMVPFDRWK